VGFYNLASLYIQPSLYEGFGIPVLEAMKCGCPVLSSNAGSLPEVGGEAALYFNPEDLGRMVNQINKLLNNDKEQLELVKKGIKRADKFSWKRVAKETLDVFKQVLAE